MTVPTITEILKLAPGTIIPAARGTVKFVGERYTGTAPMPDGTQRAWSLQTVGLEQNGAELACLCANKDEIHKGVAMGRSLYLLAHQKSRGGLSGLKVDEEEGRKILRVSASGELVWAEPGSEVVSSRAGVGTPDAVGVTASAIPTSQGTGSIPGSGTISNHGTATIDPKTGEQVSDGFAPKPKPAPDAAGLAKLNADCARIMHFVGLYDLCLISVVDHVGKSLPDTSGFLMSHNAVIAATGKVFDAMLSATISPPAK